MDENTPYSSPYYSHEINEGIAGGRGAIRYDVSQILTESQKQQARLNLGLDAVDDESEGVFWAEYGTTTYQEIIENYNLGKVCIVVDSNNDLFYLGKVETNLLTFYRSFRGVNSPQEGARIEFKYAMVASTNTWSSYYYYGENTTNRTTVVNEQSTDVQYPTAKAVYTYGQSIGAAAKDYTDEQLEPVEEAAAAAQDIALGAYVTPTASGSIASFDDGADGLPVKSLVVDIEPVQAGSGEPSPDNVRPISGRTGVQITHTGKNLIPRPYYREQLSGKTYTNNGITWTVNDDGSVTANGTCPEGGAVAEYICLAPQDNIRLPAGQYTFSGWREIPGYTPNRYTVGYMILDWADKTGLDPSVNQYLNVPDIVSIREDRNPCFVAIRIRQGITVNNATFYPQLETGEHTTTTYEPYQGETYDISFPDEAGTVYGAKLNVTTGTLTVDKVKRIYDGSRLWVKASAAENTFYYDTYNSGLTPGPASLIKGSICNQYQTAQTPALGADMTYWNLSYGGEILRVLIRDSRFSTYQEWENHLGEAYTSGTPLECVYQLATPIVYQLSPIEVRTLLGVNNIYGDAGSVEVQYRADPTIIYNKLTAAIISSGGTV